MEQNKNNLPVLALSEDIIEQVNTGQLVKHLQRAVTEAWAYQFSMDGKPVRGISAIGAHEVAINVAQQTRGQYVVRPIKLDFVREQDEYWEAQATAGLFVIGWDKEKAQQIELCIHMALGYATVKKFGVKRSGELYPITFPDRQAVSKAERNAMNKLLPAKVKEAVIEAALKEGKIEQENGNEEKETSGQQSETKKGMATAKQVQFIQQLLEKRDVPEDVIFQCQEEIEKGLSLKSASTWIGRLMKFTKKEDKNNGVFL